MAALSWRIKAYTTISKDEIELKFVNPAAQVSYVRIEAGKGRFAVWQVCDYIVTPRTIYHALAM